MIPAQVTFSHWVAAYRTRRKHTIERRPEAAFNALRHVWLCGGLRCHANQGAAL